MRVVACFGQCALAPVVEVDGVIYSRVTVSQLCSLINGLRKGGKK
ncbi:MAG TPA: NAD(P)H-dependent oxidoreductase subunit E [Treponemataceae bacterium]|nr:NAD(P)H-dependent oxidoreductase subunit E [Treponemataceae bacterium]